MESKRNGINHSGFTLVEVLLSILLIVLFMIPVLRHFFTAAKVNQQMAKMRNVEVMSENLMEAVKVRSLPQIQTQFALDDSNPEGIRSFEMLPLWDGTKQYASSLIENEIEHGIYLFDIDKMIVGTQECDVRIRLDYKNYTSGVLGSSTPNYYNEFQMPVLTELDEKALVMLYSRSELDGVSCDDRAIQIFMERRSDYIAMKDREHALEVENYNKALREAEESGVTPNPPLTVPSSYTSPNAYTESELESKMTKQIRITLENDGVNQYKVTAEVSYTVSNDLPICGDTGSFQAEQQVYQNVLQDQTYSNPIRYLYLFYEPSRCTEQSEQIVWNNNQTQMGPAGMEPIELSTYIVKQSTASAWTIPYCRLIKGAVCSSPIAFYTNLPEGNSGYQIVSESSFQVKGMVEEKPYEQWMAKIQIDVYQYDTDPGKKYGNLLYTLSSSSNK